MIQSFKEVYTRIPDAELVMVGDGPLRDAAEAMAKLLQLPVTFTGAISSYQVLDHLHAARVFCLPSITAQNGDAEGLPISIIEAQACGVPVVTTIHSGNPEGLLNMQTGFLVPERDFKGLAQALILALTNENFIANTQLACQAFARERFDSVKNTLLLENYYNNFCLQM
jgi:glycosyltransferase involved in cell wall biosynthesis